MQTIAKQIAEGAGADPGAIEDAVHRFPAGQGIRSTEKRKSKHRQKENQSTDKKKIKADLNQVKEKNHGKS